MIKFWAIAVLIFIIVTIILAKFTLKENRKETGEKNWKLWYGRSVYWRLLSLVSFGITFLIMLIMYWAGIAIL